MKSPPPKFISKKPFIISCPACSEKFDSTTYIGGHERFEQMERDYEQHFVEKHSNMTPSKLSD